MINFFAIKLIANTKKISVATASQIRLVIIEMFGLPRVSPLVMFTLCVNGKMSWARSCTGGGKTVMGKKVPLNRNIGVMKRKNG